MLTTKRLDEERAKEDVEILAHKFMGFEYKKRSCLTNLFSNIALAFSTPRVPGPFVMTGFARRALKKAIDGSAESDPVVEIDGETYVLVPKGKHATTTDLADSALRHHD